MARPGSNMWRGACWWQVVAQKVYARGMCEPMVTMRRWGLVAALIAALGCGSAGRAPATAGGSGGGTAASGGSGGGLAATGGNASGGATASSGGHAGASAGSGGVAGSGGAGASTGIGGAATGGASTGGAGAGGSSGTGGMPASQGGGPTGGAPGAGGMAAGSGGSTVPAYGLATSTSGTWTTGMWTETTNATADVTVDDSHPQQTWEGFGGDFHERGWNLLTTQALQDEALHLLFGADGARFNLAQLPIGASDYAIARYTLDDTGDDVAPTAAESNRPPADPTLSHFSIDHDKQTLIPYIKGALAVNPNIRFWAVPWTPPVWMKTGYTGTDSQPNEGSSAKPSYFDGGTMRTDAATLQAYAAYLVKFVQAYKDQGIDIESVAPQEMPTFYENYPTCQWDQKTYVTFIGQYLGPALASAGLRTNVMLGAFANYLGDPDIVTAAMSDPMAEPFIASIGVEWDMLDKVKMNPLPYQAPVWVTESKCGNYPFYPFDSAAQPATSTSPPIAKYTEPPPNDQGYAVESWWYIRDAITKGKVTAYNAVHMVLDPLGLGNDTSRAWEQNSLLTVSGGVITKTEAYYVFRHFSQFVDPGAKVLTTSGGDAVAFKNPDGSLVAVVFSAAAKSNFVVAMGGKQLQFPIPAGGWATLKYMP